MKNYRRLLVFLGLLILPAMAMTAAEPGSHEAAARRLVHITGGANMAESGAEAMMGMIRGNPDLAPYEDIFRAWYKKSSPRVISKARWPQSTRSIFPKKS